MRALAIQHIIDRPQLYMNFMMNNETVDGYIDRMRRVGEFAEGAVVLAMARALDMHLVIIGDNDAPPTVFRRSGDNIPTLYLGHHTDIHYLSLEPDRSSVPLTAKSAAIINKKFLKNLFLVIAEFYLVG